MKYRVFCVSCDEKFLSNSSAGKWCETCKINAGRPCNNCGSLIPGDLVLKFAREFCSPSCRTHHMWNSGTDFGFKKAWRVNEGVMLDASERGSAKAALQDQSIRWANPEFRERQLKVCLENLSKRTPKHHHSRKAGKVLYRSSYELQAYKLLDRDPRVRTYVPEPGRIAYTLNGREHSYVPDLLVKHRCGRKVVVEIKPESQVATEKNLAKFRAAKRFCIEHGADWEVWTEKELFDAPTLRAKDGQETRRDRGQG